MWFKKKKETVLKPPVKPEWSSVDSFIISGVIVATLLSFMGGVDLLGGMAAGYTTMFGAVFVLFQFPRFKKLLLKYKHWFDATLLFVSFFLVFSNFVFIVLTLRGCCFRQLLPYLSISMTESSTRMTKKFIRLI